MEIKNKKIYNYDVGVISAHYHSYKDPKPSDIFSSHIHNGYELLFFYDGDADIICAGSVYHLQKYDLAIIPPSTYHQVKLLSSHVYTRVVCNFYEEFIPKESRDAIKSLDYLYHVDPGGPIKRIFDNISFAEANLSKTAEYSKFIKHCVQNIIILLKNNTFSPIEQITPESDFEKILYYIDGNPKLPMNVKTLAQKFHMSESSVSHLFKKRIGLSALQYINRKKILYAQSLVLSGKPPVEVAETCSYENYPTFYRQYKKYIGLSPAEDIKRQNERQE